MNATTQVVEHPRGQVCMGCRNPLPTPHRTQERAWGEFALLYGTCPNAECAESGYRDAAAWISVHGCAGCFGHIPDGQIGQVTVTSRGHVRSVNSHDNPECRGLATTNAINDPTWIRGSHGRDY